jgi:hypothetical protein
MGSNNPLTGVGMDAYGTFYRQYRSENAATIMPGPEVASNAAHSVPLDFLAFGGVPLFVMYVGILLIGLISLIKVLHRKRDFDAVFLSLAMLWLTYQIQSLISINQLGLAIWGWVTTGALVVDGGVGIAKKLYVGENLDVTGPTLLSSSLDVTGLVNFNNTTDSSSPTTGAVVVDGGVGIAKSLYVGNNVVIGGDLTQEQATAGLAAHIPVPVPEPTIADKLALVGLSLEELREALGSN